MIYRVGYIGNLAEVAEMIFLNDRFELVHVICESDKLKEDLITFGLVRDIQITSIADISELAAAIRENGKTVDFFIMCSFGLKIPMAELSNPKIYNIHYGLLPYYKGRHPTYWATVKNEKYVGISIHKATDEIDGGEIIAQRKVPYFFWMNEGDLFHTLTGEICMLLESLVLFEEGGIQPLPNKSGYHDPRVSDREKTICLEQDHYSVIFNKIRAQSRYRGAKIRLADITVWIKDMRFVYKKNCGESYFMENGFIYIYVKDNVWIKTNNFEIEFSR